MSNILVVPINLDALVLRNDRSVVEAMADFSRMPYFNGQRDVNPDVANVSEEILSQPFQDRGLYLKAGIHLHWALPDALIKGISTPNGVRFPAVPNRWLVTRGGDGQLTQWIVESNYLHPEGKGYEAGSISFPVKLVKEGQPPFRYMGRKTFLSTRLESDPPPSSPWKEEDSDSSNPNYYHDLTAVGYGEPAFAAFYPNCHSVFGFHDDYGDLPLTGELRYDVIGWYADPAKDCLRRKDFAQADSDQHKYELLQKEFKWTLTADTDKTPAFPERTICYACIAISTADIKANPDKDRFVTIAVGNTSTEALSAHLAHTLGSDQFILEDLLEALHLAAGLEQRQLGIGPKFREARHEKEFTAVPAGAIWTIRLEGATPTQASANAAPTSEQATLPEDLAHLLNQLNVKQQAYDRPRDELESMRKQLFADWYKYMLCAYPPEDALDDYPDIDEVKYFIEENGLDPLRRETDRIGALEFQLKEALDNLNKAVAGLQRLTVADIQDWLKFCDRFRAAQPSSPVERIFILLSELTRYLLAQADAITEDDREQIVNDLNGLLAWPDFYQAAAFESFNFNLTGEAQDLLNQLPKRAIADWPDHQVVRFNRLLLEAALPEIKKATHAQRVPAPRYWRPNDPVVLVVGDAARPTDRHGTDGRLHQDGLLACQVTSLSEPTAGKTFGTAENIEQIRIEIDRLNQEQLLLSKEQIGFRTWTQQPWHPFLLEWEVELFPTQDGHNLDPQNRAYAPDFITRNYQLAENAADLSVRPGQETIDRAANVYSGRSILTPHARVRLKQVLEDYLIRLVKQDLWKDFYQDQKDTAQVPEKGNADDWLRQHLDRVITWYEGWSQVLAQFKEDQEISSQGMDQFVSWSLIRLDVRKKFLDDLNVAEEARTDYLQRSKSQFVDWYNDWLKQQARLLARFREDKNIPENDQDLTTWLRQHLDESMDWYQTQIRTTFHAMVFMEAYERLANLNVLAQSLRGFNEALLMHKQTLQLPIADPLGFDDYQDFTQEVAKAVGRSNRSAPQPLNDFNPIRCGALKLLRLRLVDTFGQVQDLNCDQVITTEVMTIPTQSRLVFLPPRLAQPARLNFRWLSANPSAAEDEDELEMNAHPATTPICGWLLPNNLDNSLMVHDQQGRALGSIDLNGQWSHAPGRPLLAASEIRNRHLKKLINHIIKQGPEFLKDFLTAIELALENIDPENFAHHEALALLMGRPIAVVRASLNLELQGRPAINQDWNVFRQDMQRARMENGQGLQHADRETDNFTQVYFPIRIGEYRQLNDGLIGYWIEDGKGYKDDKFYAPQTPSAQDRTSNIKDNETIDHPDIVIHRPNKPAHIYQSIDDPPHKLTMLLDPRGAVHATCGILPTKAIHIPTDQFADALRAIEVTFLSAPILTDAGKINLPLPAEPGYAWSWVEKENGVWADISAIGPVSLQATFAARQEIREGWLKLRQVEEDHRSEITD